MVERIDSVFSALGDPIRLQMVETLTQGPASVSALAEPHAITLAGASKHIGVLETAGLIVREKRGRERVCTLQAEALFAARDWVERYSQFWNERFDALEAALKEDADE
ncbi:MAG: metalloregulator ArsR/SmtB family transcription factor [Pseudomonadota bacterium]